MLLLARAGSQVLHPGSVELAMRSGVELLVLSSAGEPGRTAVHMLDGARRPDFAGVTRSAEAGAWARGTRASGWMRSS